MMHDDILNELKRLIGEARQDAYKVGFTDGINFIKESLHLKEPTSLEDFWNDENGDDL